MKARIAGGLLAAFLTATAGAAPPSSDFSRLIVYDVRGAAGDETSLVLDARNGQVRIWLKNDLGARSGEVPWDEYRACFEALRAIPQFALKPEYQGKGQRARAARGTVTLAWQDASGKQIKTIRYYAPEHTLDDFRRAFNSVWGLSRYAILSIGSLESPKLEYREDAVYFLSGAGWYTAAELESAADWLRRRNLGERAARSVWETLHQRFPPASEFADPAYRAYCVRKSLVRLGEPAAALLNRLRPGLAGAERGLADQILREIQAPAAAPTAAATPAPAS